ncbi:MAG: cysteine--tRNA ligase [Gammaproteobacteria bacterium]
MLMIHNSLTQQKEVFKPLNGKKVNMYVCGMTVYDMCHIGHARTVLAFDMVYRYLTFLGYDVHYVRNITDIDDKIIARAAENNEAIDALTTRFTTKMHDDLAALGALSPSEEPRATAYIPAMLSLIDTLVQKGVAYVGSDGDVFYSVRSFPEYGKLSHRCLEDMQAGERVEVNTAKRDPMDFVLWKKAKETEISWPSSYGAGRPGWHIECSAMVKQTLGECDTLDIHGGGFDLQFPHHENEIAQSEAAYGKKFANVWMHVGFINVNDEKMSKSLKNFETIESVLAKYPAEVIRFFLLSSHYRSGVNYSEENMAQAHASLGRLYTALQDLTPTSGGVNPNVKESFIHAMDDDFNSPAAMAVLFDLAREINIAKMQDTGLANSLAGTLVKLGCVFGILQMEPKVFLQGNAPEGLSAKDIEALIEKREHARAKKDFKKSDDIRQELADKGVLLEDIPGGGTRWKFTALD